MSPPGKFTCALCKQLNLRTPYYCSSCNQTFHKGCLVKNHKFKNDKDEFVDCIGHEVDDNASVFSSASTESRRKRKRSIEDCDVNDLADTIIDKLEDMGIVVYSLKEDVTNMVAGELDSFKKEILESVSEIVKREIQKALNSNLQQFPDNLIKSNSVKQSYAAIARNSKTISVVVEPKQKQKGCDTLAAVKSKVKVGNLGVGVENIKKTQSGKVVIGCAEKNDLNILTGELTKRLGENYRIKVSDKKMPKIKILDVEKEVIENESENDIVQMIKKQNELITKENTKMEIKKKITSDKDTGTLIIEVDPETHKTLIEKIRIKLGWNRCRVYDCISVLKCYKCCGYHHFAKDCQNEQKCRKCAGNHLEKECHSLIKKCVNCTKMKEEYKIADIKTDHHANDPSCECYRRVINKLQKNINYWID